MENSKEKEEVVEEVSVTKDQAETADGKVETVIEVDKKEVVSVEAESETKTGKAVASAEEVIETKEEVVVKSDGTTVVEEAEKITTIEDQAVITDDVSKGSSEVVVSEEKTEDIVAAAADAEVVVPGATPPKKLEEAESSSSNTKARESSGDVHDSAPKENPATKGNNQEISENLRSNENQQSVDPAAPTRQTSSWTNCCGLFDLLKHSSHQ